MHIRTIVNKKRQLIQKRASKGSLEGEKHREKCFNYTIISKIKKIKFKKLKNQMIAAFSFLGIIYTQRNQNQYTIKILVYTCLLWQSRRSTVALFIIHQLYNQSKMYQ